MKNNQNKYSFMNINAIVRSLLIIGLMFGVGQAYAEGTKTWSPNATDFSALRINTAGDYIFAGFDGPADRRLHIHIKDPANEIVYIGLGKQVDANPGNPINTAYNFRIKSPAGAVVHGPFSVNPANLTTYNMAVAGPDAVVGANGYPVFSANNMWVFDPAATGAGDYYIEFDNVIIQWFDITVATKNANPTAIDGRIWSKAWAVRANDGLTTFANAFDTPFNGTLIAYDGQYASKINFDGSGFIPLEGQFTFNTTGTGNTGNVIQDRKSVQDSNSGIPEHKIFLNPPDPSVYPLTAEGQLQNLPLVVSDPANPDITLEVTQSGEVEILLNLGGGFNDRQLFANVVAGVNQIPWDGKNGSGVDVQLSDYPIAVTINYTQGTTHFTAYDTEGLNNGFEVFTQTTGGVVGPRLQYWDDSNISDNPGIAGDQVNTDTGAATRRRWNNYLYGDVNTINTWWFAYKNTETTTIALAPQLTIDKDTTTPTVLERGQATYSIVVSNTGTQDATNVAISDTLPAGFTFVSATQTLSGGATGPATPTNSGTAIAPSFSGYTIPNGGSVTINLVADVNAVPGTYDNTATATADGGISVNDDGLVEQDSDTPAGQDPENDEDVIVIADPLPVTTNDTDTYTPGIAKTVSILSNDTTGDTIVPGTVKFTTTGTPGATLAADGKTLTVTGEGVWTITAAGAAVFTPAGGYTGSPTPPTYTGDDAQGNTSNEASITLTADPLPVTTDDADTYTPNVDKTVTILNNDTSGDTIVPGTVKFTTTGTAGVVGTTLSGDGKTLTVPGEGVWTIDGSGVVKFAPDAAFSGDPTPPTYIGDDAQGNTSNEASITLTADPLPVTTDDTGTYVPGIDKIVDIVNNDTTGDTINPATIVFTGTGTGVTPTNGGKELIVPNEGTWTIDPVSGAATFVALPSFTGNPTPPAYTGDDAQGNTSNESTITLTALNASIELVKSLDSVADTNTDSVTNAGDTITYSFKVTNTGDLELNPVSVTDAKVSNITCTDTLLAAGANTTCSGSYVIQQADMSAGGVENTATATGTPKNPDGSDGTPVTDKSDAGTTPDGDPVPDPKTTETANPLGENPNDSADPTEDPTTVTLLPIPSIEIVKSLGSIADTTGDSVTNAGDTITYNFTVKNTGDLALKQATVADPKVTPVTCVATTLVVGTSTSCSGNYIITVTDMNNGGVENIATANAISINPDGSDGAAVTDKSDAGTNPDGTSVANPQTTETANPLGENPNDSSDPENDPTTVSLTPPGVVAGTVYQDTNGNGVQDAGEPGISNVTVTVTDVNNVPHVLTTDENGNYAVIVPEGNTEIDIDETTLPGGFAQTQGTDTTTVTVPSGGIANDVDGYKPPADAGTVEGVVYEDINGNGSQDTGESGIPGVTVTITDVNGGMQVVTTDADGNYSATVPAGDTTVDIDETTVPGGSIQTGGTDVTVVTVPSGGTGTDTDGYQPPANAGTVMGVIYEDTDGDGIQNNGEIGLAGVQVEITDSDGNTQTVTTDADGNYSATVPVGNTTVDIDETTLPGGMTQTQGTNITVVPVLAGGTATDVDGYKPFVDTGTLEGVVYEDLNNNGTQDMGEPGIEGVAVTITDSQGGKQTLVTDTDGKYNTTVPSGATLVDIEQSDIDSALTHSEGTDPTVVNVPAGGTGSDVDGFAPAPSISIIKGSSVDKGTDGILNEDDEVTYIYVVENTSYVTLTSVSISETADFTGTGTAPLPAWVSNDNGANSPSLEGTLLPGEKATYTATYNLTQDDIDAGQIDNRATATGTPPDAPNGDPGVPVTDESDSSNLSDPNETGTPGAPEENDKTGTPLTPTPAISTIKGSVVNDDNSDGVVNLGDTITYTYIVENTGNVTLTAVDVTEITADFTGTGITPVPAWDSNDGTSPQGTLVPGEKASFSATYILTQADITAGKVDNRAMGTGTPPNLPDGNPATPVTDVSDSSNPSDPNETGTPSTPNEEDPTGTPLAQNPGIAIVKTASVGGTGSVDDVITYSFVVSNTGNVPLTGVNVDDATIGVTDLPVPNLAVGASETVTASYTITQADITAGKVENQATATGTPPNLPNGNPATPVTDLSDDNVPTEDDPTVTTLAQNPGIAIVKTASVGGTGSVDDVITYSFVVSNTGNVPLTGVNVDDATIGVTDLAVPDLAVGASETVTATYSITQADITAGKVENQATATGTPPNLPNGNPATPVTDLSDDNVPTEDDPTVTTLDQKPAVSLVKGSSLSLGDDNLLSEGDVVTYTYVLENTGNLPLTNVAVSETQADFSGLGTLPVPAWVSNDGGSPQGELKLGEKATFTATYVLTQADINAGQLDNQAVGTGTPPNKPNGDPGTPVTDNSDSSNPNDPNETGTPSTPEENDKTGTVLTPAPAIATVKGSSLALGDDGILTAGDIVTYTYKVTNMGNIVLTQVGVIESAENFSGTGTLPTPIWVSNSGASAEGTLEPAEIATFTANYVLTQEDINNGQLDNRAVGTGTPPNKPNGDPSDPVKDDSDSSNPNDPNETGEPGKPEENDKTGTALTPTPAISTVKGSSIDVGSDGILNVGDIVSYSYSVKNIGNVDMSDVAVTETASDFTGTGILPVPVWQSNDGASPQGSLVPGETAIFTAEYALTTADIASGLLNNRAVGTGTPPNKPNGDPGTPVTDESDSSNPNDPNETGTPGQPGEKDKTGTPLTPPGVAAGTVYEDTNGNGIQDAGEPGIANVTVTVTDVNGTPHVLITDENGNYGVVVPAGDVVIDIDDSTLPPGFIQSEGTDSTTVTVPSGGIGNDVDGYKPPENVGTLNGVVYEDTNGNGSQDSNEPGIQGATVTITDVNGGTQVLITDESGAYSVTVPAGDTSVQIDESTLPGGSIQTDGTNSTIISVPVNGSGTDKDGYQPPANAGKVSGIIYDDVNGDGIQNPGESGLPGVQIEVTDSAGNKQMVTTDENGSYLATVPAGETQLDVMDESLPGGMTQTAGTDLTIVTVPAGGTAVDLDGYQPAVDRGILQGVVYEDTNGNGTQDGNEPGIGGVDVTITDSQGGIQTLVTDTNGNYSTTVPSGMTLVDIEQSDIGFGFSQTEGTDPTRVLVLAGGTGSDVDGFKPPEPGRISVVKTVYGDDNPEIGHDNGAGCGTARATSRAILVDIDKSKDMPVTYCFEVTNTGETYLSDIEVTDVTLSVQHDQLSLLNGPAPSGLEPGASLLFYYEVLATESLTNTASVSAIPSDQLGHPTGGTVTSEGTSTAELALIIDPPSGIKTVTASGQFGMEWQMVWINDSNIDAPDVTVFDAIPEGTHFDAMAAGNFVSISGVYCETRGTSSTNAAFDDNCYYEAPTATYPRGRIVWKGIIASDPGLRTEASANNELVIRFNTVLDNPNLPDQEIENQGNSEWDFNNDGNPEAKVLTDNPTTPDGEPDETKFKPASNIPTLSEWMLMMLTLLLLLTGKRESLRKFSGRKF